MGLFFLLVIAVALIPNSLQLQCKCSKSIKSDKIISSSCGELLTKRRGRQMHCLKFSWRITSPAKNKKIHLHVKELALAKGDSVKVFDGIGKSHPLIAELNEGRISQPIVSSGRNLYVFLKTTCKKTRRQFKAEFTAGAMLCPKPLSSRHGIFVSDVVEEEYPLGAKLKMKCDAGYYHEGAKQTVTARCSCNGQWEYDPERLNCKPITCGEPPVAPEPKGNRNISEERVSGGRYAWNTVVNYSCPTGYGLRGLPFRICDSDGEWSTLSGSRTIHLQCIKDLAVCSDPGTPENGQRKASSFEHGFPVSHACNAGYDLIGSTLRTCHALGLDEPYWDGNEAKCKSRLKNPAQLAANLRVNFLDKVIACEDAVEEPSTAGPTDQTTDRLSLCRGRSIIVGEGCVDIAFAVDCSKSMQKKLFDKSIKFVKTVVQVFLNVDEGNARFALLTYDDEPKVHFNFHNFPRGPSSAYEIGNVSFSDFCWGATGTSDVLRTLQDDIFSTGRRDCEKAAFLITDGLTNWGGSPKQVAKELRDNNVTLYAIAVTSSESKDNTGFDSLQDLVSKESHRMQVGDIDEVIDQVFEIHVNYSECGFAAESSTCENRPQRRSVGGCLTEVAAWPWVVAIYHCPNKTCHFKCGGSIIDKYTIMTAAHCVREIQRGFSAKAEELLVVTGDRVRFQNEKIEKTHTVCNISVHQLYKDNVLPYYDHDIALLHLCCCIKYGPWARPVCLPKIEDEMLVQNDREGTVVGWGAIEKFSEKKADKDKISFPADQRQVHLSIADCKMMSTKYPGEVSENMFCAGDGTGTRDACKGDSGSPFLSQRLADGQYVATGIVSWGIGCGQSNTYGLYTNLVKYIEWIQTEKDKYSIDCDQATCNPMISLV